MNKKPHDKRKVPIKNAKEIKNSSKQVNFVTRKKIWTKNFTREKIHGKINS